MPRPCWWWPSARRHHMVVVAQCARGAPADPHQLNTYDVLINDDIVFTQAALEQFLSGPRMSGKATATSTEVEAAAEATVAADDAEQTDTEEESA